MTLYVTEHSQAQRLATQGAPITLIPTPSSAPGYALTSAAGGPAGTGVVVPSSLTEYVRVSADAGMFLSFASTVSNFFQSTTAALTSTNAFRVPANAPPELFAYPRGAKIICAST